MHKIYKYLYQIYHILKYLSSSDIKIEQRSEIFIRGSSLSSVVQSVKYGTNSAKASLMNNALSIYIHM